MKELNNNELLETYEMLKKFIKTLEKSKEEVTHD
jgi:hypothetical protein